MRTSVGDKDGAASAVGEGATSAANADLVSELLAVVSPAFGLRDVPCCERSAVACVASTVGEVVAVAACNWLTSMFVGVAVDSGFVTGALVLLDEEAPDVGATVRPPLSSMAV